MTYFWDLRMIGFFLAPNMKRTSGSLELAPRPSNLLMLTLFFGINPCIWSFEEALEVLTQKITSSSDVSANALSGFQLSSFAS